MIRVMSISSVVALLCVLQSGCCCCRGIPFAMRGGPPIVINPPPIVVAPPPGDNNPFPRDNPLRDAFKDKGVVVQPAMPRYVYSQRTGELKLDNQVVGNGYSGKGPNRNNPAMQAVQDGPIPIGEYMFTGRRNDPRLGGNIMGLLPVAGGNNFNRFPRETFAIIPETNPPGNPPPGCFIVLPANVLDALRADPLTKIQVVP